MDRGLNAERQKGKIKKKKRRKECWSFCSRKVATLPSGNEKVLKDFITSNPVFVLRKQVVSVVVIIIFVVVVTLDNAG
jgi:hypothetical protein